MTTQSTKPAGRAVIIGHGTSGYGLCYGYTEESNDTILARRTVTVTNGRHIAYYKTAKGGLTSLARIGPYEDSRIGLPVDKLGLAEVLTVLDVSDEAEAKFRDFRCQE